MQTFLSELTKTQSKALSTKCNELELGFIDSTAGELQQSLVALVIALPTFIDAVTILKVTEDWAKFKANNALKSLASNLEDIKEVMDLLEDYKGQNLIFSIDDEDLSLTIKTANKPTSKKSLTKKPPVEVEINGLLLQGSSANICRHLDDMGIECPIQDGIWYKERTNLKNLLKTKIGEVGGTWRDGHHDGNLIITEL